MAPNPSIEGTSSSRLRLLEAAPHVKRWAARMLRLGAEMSAFGLLTAISFVAFADTPPPKAPFDAVTWGATLKAEPSLGMKMGSFYVRLEKTTLDDVRRATSMGDIAHQGDAGESVYWLCYTNVTSAAVERIWIMAHGEMGGPEHSITNITAQLLAKGSATKECPALPRGLTPLSLDHHIWLQDPVSDVLKKLGEPSYEKGPWRSFDYQGKVPGNCGDEGFDLMNSLLVRAKSGRVQYLYLDRVTSC